MNKYSYVPYLKIILCFSFFAASGLVFGMKTVQEPENITITTSKDYYVEYDSEKKLWFGMEPVTSENVIWWKKRIAYDVYMYFKSQENSKFAKLDHKLFRKMFENFYKPLLWEIESNDEFMNELQMEAEWNKKSQDDWLDTENLMNSCERDISYADALNGFMYNLEHYTNGGEKSTWIAYVSRIPVSGPLHSDGNFNVTSHNIIMVMTFKMGKDFYTPLGICRSSIGRVFDRRNKVNTGNLSMPLHSFVARNIKKIRSSIKYMVVRPLKSMMEIFMSSGLRYSVSADGNKQDSVPHIQWEKGKECLSYPSHHIPYNFALVDPLSDTRYNISDNHWFCKSPYLGFTTCELFKKSPFVVIERTELGDYTDRDIVHRFISNLLKNMETGGRK